MTIKSNQALLNAPFGSILLTFKDGELIRCELSEAAVEEDLGSFADHKAVQALNSYLEGNIHALDNWKPGEECTEFRCQVWKEIAKIKAGDTVTYGQIADNLAALLVLWVPPAETIRCRFLLGVIALSERAIGRIRAFGRQCLNKCWLLKHEQQNM